MCKHNLRIFSVSFFVWGCGYQHHALVPNLEDQVTLYGSSLDTCPAWLPVPPVVLPLA
jgi:hypothetical protein